MSGERGRSRGVGVRATRVRAEGALARFVDRLVAGGEATAAVGLVADAAGPLALAAAGERADGRPAGAGTLFDLASLTKPFVASLALRLDAAGRLPLDLPIGEVWAGAAAELARQPLADLLRHRAGLRPWAPLYARCGSPAEVRRLLLAGRWGGARRGTYSDLGYILWGLSAEHALGRPVQDLLLAHLVDRPGLREVTARPAPARLAPCPLDNGREVELAAAEGVALAPVVAPPIGRPQDGNARFLGRRAGHAGLFGPVTALASLGREWLAPGDWLPPEAVAGALAGGGGWALGWARRRRRGSAGPALSRRAFGHTGFTGGSLWVDPERSRLYVLLAHRRDWRVDFQRRRRAFHRLAAGLAAG